MGCADLVPGISGGTMAFLLGIYSELIDSIRLLSKGVLRAPLSFLLPLGLGMALAFLTLSPLIHTLLEHQTSSTALYFLFFFFLLYATRKTYSGSAGHRPLFFLAGAALVGLTRFAAPPELAARELPLLIYVLAGFFAVIAMLLPGISGSTLLLIFGIYPPLIRHLSSFSLALRAGHFDREAFWPLLSFACGALIGALVGARLIHRLLTHYQSATLSLLIGLMAGGAFVLWPLESALPPLLLIAVTFLIPRKKAEVL